MCVCLPVSFTCVFHLQWFEIENSPWRISRMSNTTCQTTCSFELLPLHSRTTTFDTLGLTSICSAQIHVHYNWIYCASPKVFQKKSQKLINKKTHPAHTRAPGCARLLCFPDIQLQGSIMWDFCLKTDSLRASKPNFDMQQILFLPFHRLNPYLSLLLVNAFSLYRSFASVSLTEDKPCGSFGAELWR